MVIRLYEELYKELPEDTVGQRIHKVRKLKGIDKKSLANYIGIVPQSMDSFEFGGSFLSPEKLIKLSQFLETPIEYFYDEYYEFVLGDYDKKLLEWRENNNFTLKEAAEIIGVHYVTLSKWERGIVYPDRVSYKKVITLLN